MKHHFSTILLLTVLMLVVLNVVLGIFYDRHDSDLSKENQISLRYGEEKVLDAYPHRSKGEVDTLLNETWGRRMAFQSFVDFVERPRKGYFLNISPDGYRFNGQVNPWPVSLNAFNIFVYGGSTTFGYGVADDETIPHYLQSYLNDSISRQKRSVRVYNFGAGYHYSVQERVRFEQMLLEGHEPDLAIFIDGVNDLYLSEPEFADELSKRFDEDGTDGLWRWWHHLPMHRLAASLRFRLFGNSLVGFALPEHDSVDWPKRAVSRYAENMKLTTAVAVASDIKVFHVWQPSPYFNFMSNELPFLKDGPDLHFMRSGYHLMQLKVQDTAFHNYPFLWLGDLRPERKPYFVDHIHYSAQYHKLIAEKIAKELQRRNLLKP